LRQWNADQPPENGTEGKKTTPGNGDERSAFAGRRVFGYERHDVGWRAKPIRRGCRIVEGLDRIANALADSGLRRSRRRAPDTLAAHPIGEITEAEGPICCPADAANTGPKLAAAFHPAIRPRA